MSESTNAKVIDLTAAKQKRQRQESLQSCPHKDVVVYRDSRRVYCSRCGAELDPFEVLVRVVEAQPPAPYAGDELAPRPESGTEPGSEPGPEPGTDPKDA